MGQTLGRATLTCPEIAHLANLPKPRVYDLWEAFNDVAEGFGLSPEEVRDMLHAALRAHLRSAQPQLPPFRYLLPHSLHTPCVSRPHCSPEEVRDMLRAALRAHLRLSDAQRDGVADALFTALDDDRNGLVDALELLGGVALLSGMSLADKARFVFAIYDFDESGRLSADEMVLALRSTVSGISKLTGVDPPLETELEALVRLAFDRGAEKKGAQRAPAAERHARYAEDEQSMTMQAFEDYCRTAPELLSWVDYVGDIAEPPPRRPDHVDKHAAAVVTSMSHRGQALSTDVAEGGAEEGYVAATDLEAGCAEAAAIESRGLASTLEPQAQWQNAAAFTEPTLLPRGGPQRGAPPSALSLEWAYGYSAGNAARGSAKYTPAGDVIYPVGAVGVALRLGGRGGGAECGSQRHFQGHTDAITCLDVGVEEEGRVVVATGQLGRRPKLAVWCAETCTLLGSFRGVHGSGIALVRFSPDAALTLSVGMEPGPEVSLAVRHWPSQTTIFTSTCSGAGAPTIAVTFAGGGDRFATCGVDHVTLWDRSSTGPGFERSTGVFGPTGLQQTQLCCLGFDGGAVATGGGSGHVSLWEGRNCTKCVKGHAAAVTVIAAGAGGAFVTGAADGKLAACFDTRSLPGAALLGVHALHSISWAPSNRRMLVATEAGELDTPEQVNRFCESGVIAVITDSDGACLHKGGALASGHCHGGWGGGIATHPHKPDTFCSVGLDRTVRMWNRGTKRCVASVLLDTPAHCVAFHPDGDLLCVGLGGDSPAVSTAATPATRKSTGGGKAPRKEGAFLILRTADLSVAHEARDSKKTIRAVGWSPDGLTLAVASDDASVYLYAGGGTFMPKARCAGHRGGIAQCDFSADGRFLQSVSASARELLFWDTDRGEQAREVGGSISGARRAVGRPVVHTGLSAWEYRGPGAPAGEIAWCADDAAIITVGRRDCALLQWAHADLSQQRGRAPETRLAAALAPEMQEGATADGVRSGSLEAVMAMEEATDAAEQEARFAPMRPWHRHVSRRTSIAAPSDPPPANLREPDCDLVLEWVHGAGLGGGGDRRGTVKYSADGRLIVLLAGTLAVVREQGRPPRQRFYRAHTDDALCLALHPSLPLAATGQQGLQPWAAVWDVNTMETARVLRGHHRCGVVAIAFSPDGTLLATAGGGGGAPSTIVVWDWERQAVIAAVDGGGGIPQEYLASAPANAADGRPPSTLELAFERDGGGLIEVGDSFIRFWSLATSGSKEGGRTISRGHNVVCRDAVISSRGKLQPFYCIGAGLVSGGRDGLVKVWKKGLELRATFNLNLMEVGTAGNSLLELNATTGECAHTGDQGECAPLDCGHGGSGLHGLACNPACPEYCTVGEDRLKACGIGLHGLACNPACPEYCTVGEDRRLKACSHGGSGLHGLACNLACPEYCTVGEDRRLRVWDIYKRTCIRTATLEVAARAVAYSHDGARLAVGFGKPMRDSARQFDGLGLRVGLLSVGISVQAVGAPPTTESRAACARLKLSRVYIYDTKASYVLSAVVAAHNARVTAVDFSKDSRYIRSTCDAHELYYCEADTGLAIPAASRLRNVAWHTCTALFSWHAQGAWPPQRDGTELQSLDATGFQGAEPSAVEVPQAVATGDGYGRVRLLRYPALSAHAVVKTYGGHGGAGGGVARVRWTQGDSHLISVGARDGCVMQWRHANPDPNPNPNRFSITMHRPALGLQYTIRQWASGDSHLISVGASDGCVMQWRHERDDAGAEQGKRNATKLPGAAALAPPQDLMPNTAAALELNEGHPPPSLLSPAALAPEDAFVESAAVRRRRWTDSVHMVEPSYAREQRSEPAAWDAASSMDQKRASRSDSSPRADRSAEGASAEPSAPVPEAPALRWAHGCMQLAQGTPPYRADACVELRCRSSLAYVASGELASVAGGDVALYSRKRNAQRFAKRFARDQLQARAAWAVLCASADGRLIATASAELRAVVAIWDCGSGEQLCQLPEALRQGAVCLAFNHNARQLVGVGGDSGHGIAIWQSCSSDWHDAELLSTATGDAQRVAFAAFAAPAPAQEFALVSGGQEHVKFWTLQGRSLTAKLGLIEGQPEAGKGTALCGAAVPAGPFQGKFLTGMASGHLLVWRGRKTERAPLAHLGGVTAIASYEGGVVTGGQDGLVKLWSLQLEQLKIYDLAAPEVMPVPLRAGMRAVKLQLPNSTHIIILCELYQLLYGHVCTAAAPEVMPAPLRASVRAVAAASAGRDIVRMAAATAGGEVRNWCGFERSHSICCRIAVRADCTVRVWSVSHGRVLRKALLTAPCRAVAWSPDGRRLIVGAGDGKGRRDGAFWVLEADTLAVAFEGRDSRGWVRAAAFAPDGRSFALASHDGKVYVYDVPSFGLRCRCQGHTAPVIAIDYSDDSQHVQSCALDGTLMRHSALEGSALAIEAQLKHLRWPQWTLSVGWPMQRAWPALQLEESGAAPAVTAAHASSRGLLACGYADGTLRVFPYPAVPPSPLPSLQSVSPPVGGHKGPPQPAPPGEGVFGGGAQVPGGHVGHVACVRFTCDGRRLVTVGGVDRVVRVHDVLP
ncbi:WD40-repeat-containing domain protein [Tribonema minus]|uniref:WD40-repeat-containing domain protein n=1 Tax=Tribonema minus TaxID=303371 RepID=A0A835ZKM6_9STRA|nr:WD40-repeat-containing domain protein [Tribonema minus]